MAFYLAFKEVWRNRSKFFLFSMVIALITTLVLFVAALAEGLATANKEYLEKIDAQLIVFQAKVDLSAATSQIERSRINNIQRVDGVEAVGSIGFSSAAIVPASGEPVNVSLVGVEAGKPGEPPVFDGRGLETTTGSEVILDGNLASKEGLKTGDTITIKTIQNAREEYFDLRVVGITDGRQYLFRPSIFVPLQTWDRMRPRGASRSFVELITNVVAVRVAPGLEPEVMKQRIQQDVADVEVADIRTAYEAIPGYSVQQSTLNTMQGFTLLIGVLVIGGFFQIQMLQKVPLIGVLKAIGTSDASVAASVVLQIILVTTFGVFFGGAVVLLLGLFMPSGVPIVFSGRSVALAVAALLSIGPAGGLVSVRSAIRVEPLRALGLSN